MKVKNLLLALALLAAPLAASAQGQYTITTLSTKVSDSATNFVVASNTGFAPASNTESAGQAVRQIGIIDNEEFEIYSVSGSTFATVTRGIDGTDAVQHAAGAYMYIGPPLWFLKYDPSGSCVYTSQRVLPVFSIDRARKSPRLFNCDGTWHPQTLPSEIYQAPLEKFCAAGSPGYVAYGSSGTSTSTSSTVQLNSSIFVPKSFIATGITVLNGSAADTAMHRTVFLSPITGAATTVGAVIGNSASTAIGTSDAFQAIAFTTPKLVSGPAFYIASVQTDGTDVNSIRTIAASTFNNVLASSTTSVYGVLSLVAPTTFTADVGVMACLY